MLNPTDTAEFETDATVERIEFTRLPNNAILQSLNTFLSNNPETLVRFYSSKGDWTNLEFLRQLPKLRRLLLHNTDIRNPITNLAPIANVEQLELLNVSDIANRKFDFTPLLKFKESLVDLSIGINKRAHSNYFETVRRLTALTSFGSPFVDFSTISTLKELRCLGLGAGPFSNTQSALEFKKLRHIRCFQSKLDSLDFVFFPRKMETIELVYMPNRGINSLPERSPVKFLYLEGFKSIETFESLITFPRLETLVIRNCHLPPSHFEFLANCKRLKRVFVEYQSQKRQDEFAEYIPSEKLLTSSVLPEW